MGTDWWSQRFTAGSNTLGQPSPGASGHTVDTQNWDTETHGPSSPGARCQGGTPKIRTLRPMVSPNQVPRRDTQNKDTEIHGVYPLVGRGVFNLHQNFEFPGIQFNNSMLHTDIVLIGLLQ